MRAKDSTPTSGVAGVAKNENSIESSRDHPDVFDAVDQHEEKADDAGDWKIPKKTVRRRGSHLEHSNNSSTIQT